MTPEEDRYYALGNVLEGLALLEGTSAFASLIPEIRSNLVMCLALSEGPEDVVGVPGRITSFFGQPRAAARPALGGSHYTARIVLAVRREMANLRAALEIKYSSDLVAVIERIGLQAKSPEAGSGVGGSRRAGALALLLRDELRSPLPERRRILRCGGRRPGDRARWAPRPARANPRGSPGVEVRGRPGVRRSVLASRARRLRLETPESFRSEEGRETFALLTEVRQALVGRPVRDRRPMMPIKREF